MIVERKVFQRRDQEGKPDSNVEQNDSVETEQMEETWEWDGTVWLRVS